MKKNCFFVPGSLILRKKISKEENLLAGSCLKLLYKRLLYLHPSCLNEGYEQLFRAKHSSSLIHVSNCRRFNEAQSVKVMISNKFIYIDIFFFLQYIAVFFHVFKLSCGPQIILNISAKNNMNKK